MFLNEAVQSAGLLSVVGPRLLQFCGYDLRSLAVAMVLLTFEMTLFFSATWTLLLICPLVESTLGSLQNRSTPHQPRSVSLSERLGAGMHIPDISMGSMGSHCQFYENSRHRQVFTSLNTASLSLKGGTATSPTVLKDSSQVGTPPAVPSASLYPTGGIDRRVSFAVPSTHSLAMRINEHLARHRSSGEDEITGKTPLNILWNTFTDK